jgi:folate-binding Fe-S cluster repair protein YgfZ
LVLTKQGKILADVTVVAGDTEAYLGVVRSGLERVADWLAQYLVMEDAAVEDSSAEFAWSMLHGPMGFVVAKRLAEGAGFEGAFAPVDFTGFGGAALVARRPSFERIEASLPNRPDVRIGTADDWLRLRIERLVPITGIDIDEQRALAARAARPLDGALPDGGGRLYTRHGGR